MTQETLHSMKRKSSSIYLMVFFSGLAALSWTVIWQIESSLALGVSAWGAALTLAVTMGGMCIGALAAGYALRANERINPSRIYGVLEILIGISGLFLIPALQIAEDMDTSAYRQMAGSHYGVHLIGIILSMGFPAICMGATTPVFGLMARQHGTSISVLYGLNTIGAASGSVIAAFAIIPLLGVQATAALIAAVNLMVGIYAIICFREKFDLSLGFVDMKSAPAQKNIPGSHEYMLVFLTGFATLALEVAWFRSFTATFWSTTAAFSIMLSSVLISLGCAAQLVPLLKRKGVSLALCVSLAGIAILLATPVVERFDWLTTTNSRKPAILFLNWFFLTLYITGLPMLLLGLGLPWVLDNQTSTRRWGTLYGVNTLAAVLGSITAGWILLPTIGFARTSWLIGSAVALLGILILHNSAKTRIRIFLVAAAALSLAVVFESGVGRTRIQSHLKQTPDNTISILSSHEGPDATVSVIEFSKNKERALVIDGFVATSQMSEGKESTLMTQYMLWMGHLPMLLHPDPKKALVICFGTGQTANALRRENPQALTIVDINRNVFNMAPLFSSNQGILEDKRVTPVVMDGRAFLRRTQDIYDVITLEPMPPTFAGVNALYSKEFYITARKKMSPQGVIAQWLPFHLLSPYHTASISRTFNEVFPNSVLWIDPQSMTGILLGSNDDKATLGENFPGFERNKMERLLPDEKVKKSVYLKKEALKAYGEQGGDMVTDDNQLLAYGSANFSTHGNTMEITKENYDSLKAFKASFYKTLDAAGEGADKNEPPLASSP